MVDDPIWQQRYRRLVASYLPQYERPQGHIGKRFIQIQTVVWQSVHLQHAKSEKALYFALIILRRTPNVKKAKDIKTRLEKRMDLWEQGKCACLVNDTVAEGAAAPGGRGRKKSEETSARTTTV